MPALRQRWEARAGNQFADAEERAGMKVVFDPTTGEVRLLGRWKGEVFGETLLVEHNLAATLEEAKSFIQPRTSQRIGPGSSFPLPAIWGNFRGVSVIALTTDFGARNRLGLPRGPVQQ
jgi:hypothetical protein